VEQSAVLRWLEHTGLRANTEPQSNAQEKPTRSTRGKGSVVRPEGSLGGQGNACFVSVTRASKGSPGAASARYHERDGVEILHDGDMQDWKGDRYSIVINPQNQQMGSVEMGMLADHVLDQLERRFARDGNDSVQGDARLHHRESGSSQTHLHLAVNATTRAGRPVLLTQAALEKAVARALQHLERTREMGMER
jgi:hypothetical protein